MTLAEKIKHLPISRDKSKGRRSLMTDPFEEMDQVFDRLLGRSLLREWMHPKGWWPFESGTERGVLPRVDVSDRDDEIVIRAEMPGVKKEDLDISLSDNTITLRGTIKEEEQEVKEGEYYYYRETGHGEFVRSLALPATVDGTKVKATFKNGVLHVVLPKTETAKRQKIQIN